ncbi:MAG: hypothetical protein OEM81_02355 [Acidimicrobiia bacterium]|nr:hypothetical protein [Acidimicrobiia bacterium]MDH3396655.1 hypothetical protein [Acidimicrobiia bacterium]MDH5615365.1 hypothetical protein [Acidimicrobiia bacterium]
MLTANDCTRCAARDAVLLENGENFCPWCLHTWPASGGLILDRDSGQEQDFLEELVRVFEQD